MRHLFTVALLALPVSSVAAMYDAEYEQCNQLNTVGIVECVGKLTQAWDRRLNTAYKALMERSDPEQQQPLKVAQRLWIKYRDANCAYYGSAQGSIRQIWAAECFRTMTKQRTCELQNAGLMEGRPEPECQ